jgi:hypothetical protein
MKRSARRRVFFTELPAAFVTSSKSILNIVYPLAMECWSTGVVDSKIGILILAYFFSTPLLQYYIPPILVRPLNLILT